MVDGLCLAPHGPGDECFGRLTVHVVEWWDTGCTASRASARPPCFWSSEDSAPPSVPATGGPFLIGSASGTALIGSLVSRRESITFDRFHPLRRPKGARKCPRGKQSCTLAGNNDQTALARRPEPNKRAFVPQSQPGEPRSAGSWDKILTRSKQAGARGSSREEPLS